MMDKKAKFEALVQVFLAAQRLAKPGDPHYQTVDEVLEGCTRRNITAENYTPEMEEGIRRHAADLLVALETVDIPDPAFKASLRRNFQNMVAETRRTCRH
jgi:hypothetical protein